MRHNHLSGTTLLLIFVLFCAESPVTASPWKTAQGPHFYFHYVPQDERVVRQIIADAETVYREITEDVDYTPRRKVAVYFCPTPECFQQKQIRQAKIPEWAVGVAYPAFDRIVMRSALTTGEKGRIKPHEIFRHEFAHIVLEQALMASGGAPRWLSEGFSMYHARQWTLYGQRTIENVTLRKRFIPLHVLTTSFPAEEQAARVAYAQSFSLVAFLLNEYGRPIFHRFLENLKQGMNTDTALRSAAGVSLKRLEREWQASLQRRYSWPAYLMNSGFFWFALSVVFLLSYLLKRQQVKKTHQRWEEEEYELSDWEPPDSL